VGGLNPVLGEAGGDEVSINLIFIDAAMPKLYISLRLSRIGVAALSAPPIESEGRSRV
jgi:hypothetical protein